MRLAMALLLSSLAALACAGCLRVTYNRCTETPPERECELLDAGTEAGADAGTDAAGPDADVPDAHTADAGTDAG